MSYTAPPTFVDDQILSAAQLNILARDIEYFNGLAGGVNMPFAEVALPLNATKHYRIRHRGQYLHLNGAYHIDLNWNDTMRLVLTYGGVTIYDVTYDRTVTGDTGTLALSLDLVALVAGITDGTWYEIVARVYWDGGEAFIGASHCTIHSLYESAEA